jgi:hypothetical protein
MRSNPIEALMAGCTEANLAVEDGARAAACGCGSSALPSRRKSPRVNLGAK